MLFVLQNMVLDLHVTCEWTPCSANSLKKEWCVCVCSQSAATKGNVWSKENWGADKVEFIYSLF